MMGTSTNVSRKLTVAFAAILLALSGQSSAVTVNFSYGDGPGEGFYDPTLGTQRRTAWEFAVNAWASRLSGDVPISVKASFENLGTGDPAVLGRAGANYIHRDFPGAPQARTWYDDPLANQFRMRDIITTEPDVEAIFNNQVDTLNALGEATFYYGLDENVPSNKVSFVRLAMHEICHGLGFATVIKSSDGTMPDNLPSVYDKLLVHYDGANWQYIHSQTDSQRYASITSANLYFNGDKTYISNGNKLPPMFAPSQPYPGSSVSHFDYKRFTPSQLMEPVLFGTDLNPGLADEVLDDIGWEVAPLPVVKFKGRRPSPFDNGTALVEGGAAYSPVTLSSPALSDTLVTFSATGINGAVEGVDYVIETDSPLVIPQGGMSATIAVRALSTPELTTGKAVTVTLRSSSGAEISSVGNSITLNLEDTHSSVEDWLMYR